MVGVAGKSKGCNTCRKRKIHCDGSKPSCARCIKSNRVCGGYQRERHFKNLSALDRETLLTRTQPLTSLTDLRTVNSLTPRSTPDSDDTASLNNQIVQRTSLAPLSLSDLFGKFLEHYIPREEPEFRNGNKAQLSWLQAINPSSANNASLDLAILALSLTCLGRKHGDERLRREGTANYGKALHRLQDILSHHNLLFEEQTLASCMALSTFELLEVSGDNFGGWASHVEGMGRLIQLRGPESHVHGLSHRLFLGFRSTSITYALATRKSTYLAQQGWLTVPWKMHPKSDLDRLQDAMAQIANLIERAGQLNTTVALTASETAPTQREEIMQEGRELHCQLENWYQDLTIRQPGPLYYERPSSADFLSRFISAFPNSLHFQNFEIAHLHLSYWTTLLLLYSSMLTVTLSSLGGDASQTFGLVMAPMTDKFTQGQVLAQAKKIAQSMEYLLSEEMHILGPQKVFFALRSAMHVFTSAGEREEVERCEEVFEELDRRGYSFGKILCRCEWDDIPALLSGKSIPRNGVVPAESIHA